MVGNAIFLCSLPTVAECFPGPTHSALPATTQSLFSGPCWLCQKAGLFFIQSDCNLSHILTKGRSTKSNTHTTKHLILELACSLRGTIV